MGIIGAPFLFIDSLNNGFSINHTTAYSGFFNFAYITGWMCSIIALYRMGSFGKGRLGKLIFFAQMTFLTLANCWNIYEWIKPNAGTWLYFFLDPFWPISNFFMLITGITIIRLGDLNGWRRYVPLIVGGWLPLGIVLWVIFTRTPGVLLTLSAYSLIAWSLMAISIITFPGNTINNTDSQVKRKRILASATYFI
jgi:hypothetical protein